MSSFILRKAVTPRGGLLMRRSASTWLPSVSRLLAEGGLDDAAARQIPTTGPHGRLLKGDVLAHLGRISARPAMVWEGQEYPPFGGSAPGPASVETAVFVAGPYECRWGGVPSASLLVQCDALRAAVGKRVHVEELVARALSKALSSEKAVCSGPRVSRVVEPSTEGVSVVDFLRGKGEGKSPTISLEVSEGVRIPRATTSSEGVVTLDELIGGGVKAVSPQGGATLDTLILEGTPSSGSVVARGKRQETDPLDELLSGGSPSRTQGTLQLKMRSLPGSALGAEEVGTLMGRVVNLLSDPKQL